MLLFLFHGKQFLIFRYLYNYFSHIWHNKCIFLLLVKKINPYFCYFNFFFLIRSQNKLVYYRHNETGFVIYDFRPLVNFGGGVFFENTIGSSFIDQEVLHQINNLEDFHNIPRLFIFCTSCSGVTFYGIVEQSIIRCPLCERIIRWIPWFYHSLNMWESKKSCLDELSLFSVFCCHCYFFFLIL